MNLEKYTGYLSGNDLSVDLSVHIGSSKDVVEKMDYITKIIEGKKVVDVGFADHYDIIDERLANGMWVHGIFRKVASKILGVDIDPKAIAYLKEKFRFEDVYCHDITSPELLAPIANEDWDYLVLSEVLEHVGNPVDFLKAIKANYGVRVKKVIISVPNAWGIITLKSVLKAKERINSDHRFWFTPYTLAKVVTDAGYKIEEFKLCNSYYKLSRTERALVKKSPLLHHTLVMVISM